jgi:hypothetical protein
MVIYISVFNNTRKKSKSSPHISARATFIELLSNKFMLLFPWVTQHGNGTKLGVLLLLSEINNIYFVEIFSLNLVMARSI